MYQVIEFYIQNLQLARDTGNPQGELAALNSLGRAYQALAEHDKAVECYEAALKIAHQLSDVRAERNTLKNLNDVLEPAQKSGQTFSQEPAPPNKKQKSKTMSAKTSRKKSPKRQVDKQPGKKLRSAGKKQTPADER